MIRGQVLGPYGSPVQQDVTITTFLLRAGSPVKQVKTDFDGAFELQFPEGPAVIMAFAQHVGFAFALRAGTGAFRLRLEPMRRLKGVVLDDEGKCFPKVLVSQQMAFRVGDALVFPGFPHGGAVVQKRENVYVMPPRFLSTSLAL